MKVDWSLNQQHLEKACEALQVSFLPGTFTWLSVVSGDEVLAVVVYSEHSNHNCEITVVTFAPHCFTRNVLRELFAYPFFQLGLRRVTAVVRQSNLRSLTVCEKLGFQIEGLLRNWFGDEDGFILGLLREECKWIY